MSLAQNLSRELADKDEKPMKIKDVMVAACLVVIFVSVLEVTLHNLEHYLKQHHKYYEMLSKVYRGTRILSISISIDFENELLYLCKINANYRADDCWNDIFRC